MHGVDGGWPEPFSTDLDGGTMFELLRSPDRRTLLSELEVTREYTLDELTEVLLATADRTEAHKTQATLYHVHLPKLDDAGLLNWDRERGTVGLAAGGARLFDATQPSKASDD